MTSTSSLGVPMDFPPGNPPTARGMHVAFAMTGNRVEKTLRKAGLRKFIGDQWFFPTVEVPIFVAGMGDPVPWMGLVWPLSIGSYAKKQRGMGSF